MFRAGDNVQKNRSRNDKVCSMNDNRKEGNTEKPQAYIESRDNQLEEERRARMNLVNSKDPIQNQSQVSSDDMTHELSGQDMCLFFSVYVQDETQIG